MGGVAATLHLFVHVVRSRQDPFAGLRKALMDLGDTVADVRFDEQILDLIDTIEYTGKRALRAWRYRPVFRQLDQNLRRAMSAHAGPINIYLSDEGVWAVFLAQFLDRLGRNDVIAVNVQHGAALLSPVRYKSFRRVLNGIATFFTGYPAIGMGSAGGAGRKPFHLYLTYDEATAAFARAQTSRIALPVPRLIKHELIAGFHAAPPVIHGRPHILFAMNINVPGSPVLCDLVATYDCLTDLAKAAHHAGAVFVVRRHPGMDQEKAAQQFASHPISDFAILDVEPDLYASMARSRIVMSFLSTALWEGGLLGLLPVQVLCRCCAPVTLSFDCAQFDLDADLPEQLLPLLAHSRETETDNWQALESQEWSRVKMAMDQIMASAGGADDTGP